MPIRPIKEIPFSDNLKLGYRAILHAAELEAFTGRTERGQRRYGSQEKELKALNIPYLKRTNGTLIVYRAFVDMPIIV